MPRTSLQTTLKQQQAAHRQRESVLRASALIEQSATPLPLAELARQVGMSPYHFHRVFREITGVTPHR